MGASGADEVCKADRHLVYPIFRPLGPARMVVFHNTSARYAKVKSGKAGKGNLVVVRQEVRNTTLHLQFLGEVPTLYINLM